MLERDLAYAEEYYYYRRSWYNSGGFSMSGEYSMDISLSLLFKGLKRMIETYPQLSLQVYEERDLNGNLQDKKVRFLDSYKFSDLVEVIDYDNDPFIQNETNGEQLSIVDQLHKRYISHRFEFNNMNSPLWKIKFVKPNIVLFCCDHVFFDGKSGVRFHEILRDTLNSVLFQEDRMKKFTTIVDYSDDEVMNKELFNYNSRLFNEIPPPNISVVDYSLNFSHTARLIYSHFCPSIIQRFFAKILRLFNFKSKNTIASRTRDLFNSLLYKTYKRTDLLKDEHLKDKATAPYARINISSETLKKILSKCKSENVKFTALMMTISHLAIIPISKEMDVQSNIAVNLRPLAHQVETCNSREFQIDFGTYVSAIEFMSPSLANLYPKLYAKLLNLTKEYQQEDLVSQTSEAPLLNNSNDEILINWDIARYIQERIEKEFIDSPKLFGALKLVNVADFINYSGTKTDVATVVLSNVGTTMATSNDPNIEPSATQVQIKDMIFSQAAVHFTGYITTNVIGTDLGGVNIAINGMHGLEKEVDLYVSVFQKIVDDLVRDL